MITAGDFRNGSTFELDGQVFQVVEFMHVKPGKGAAFVRTKLKTSLGATIERTFSPYGQDTASISSRMQYLYNDGDLFYL